MKTLNQSQIKVIRIQLIDELYNHFNNLEEKKELPVDPRVTKLITEGEALKAKIDKLTKTLEKENPHNAFTYPEVSSYYSEKSLVRSTTKNYKAVGFKSEHYKTVCFSDHKLATKAEKAIAELNRYLLGLQLGTETINDMDNIIAKLTK